VFRGSALAITSATLTVAAHTVAGGMPPDTGLTVLLTLGVAAVGVALAGRRRSPGAILAVLGAAQLASHVLLSFGDSVGAMSAGDLRMVAPVTGTAMLGAHVLAVLLSAALLAGAETAVFVVAGVLAMLLPRLLTAPPVPSAPPDAGARRFMLAQDRYTAVLLRRSHARRGPPVTA
jgi:hypothetical protein